jgi:hypothetical protein
MRNKRTSAIELYKLGPEEELPEEHTTSIDFDGIIKISIEYEQIIIDTLQDKELGKSPAQNPGLFCLSIDFIRKERIGSSGFEPLTPTVSR